MPYRLFLKDLPLCKQSFITIFAKIRKTSFESFLSPFDTYVLCDGNQSYFLWVSICFLTSLIYLLFNYFKVYSNSHKRQESSFQPIKLTILPVRPWSRRCEKNSS